MSDIRPSCVICAWKVGCQKQFSIKNPSTCPDFSRDVTIRDYPGKKGLKIIIEGLPGVGKTTLIERMITRMQGKKLGGYTTREIIRNGATVGFKIVSLDKLEAVLAHEDLSGGHKVGRYTVNIEALDSVCLSSLRRAIASDDIIVIDEIGEMEIVSDHFRELVENALKSGDQVVATVGMDCPAFIEDIKHDKGVRLLTLTADNRDDVLEDVVRMLEED